MSTASKITFVVSGIVAAGIIGYVHHKQNSDRLKLHEGVLRDVERQQKKHQKQHEIAVKEQDE
ncbi:Uncharacterised protein g11149, partial [Pycnogonum litorale]